MSTPTVTAGATETEAAVSSQPANTPEKGNTLSPALLAEYAEQLREQEELYAAECAERHQRNLEAESARTRANRQNALFSTGPRTFSGKEISKMNAVRHGLTGRQVLLSTEDADTYSAHCARFHRDCNPQTERELELTQMLADTQWRLNRIPGLELAIFAFGRMRYADLFLDADPALRARLIEYYILEQHAKQFRNLALQENRLRRNLERDRAELTTLQTARHDREKMKTVAADLMAKYNPTAPPETPSDERVRFSDSPKPAENILDLVDRITAEEEDSHV